MDAHADIDFLGAPTGYPSNLLDAYVNRIQGYRRGLLPVSVVRSGSTEARRLLASSAREQNSEPETVLEDFLTESRWRPFSRSRSIDVNAIMELSRVMTLQAKHNDDLVRALQLADRALKLSGPRRIASRLQAFHIQLALHLGARERVDHLLAKYDEIPEIILNSILADLDNPFRGGPNTNIDSWIDRFSKVSRSPGIRITPGEGHTPFDRLSARPGYHTSGPLVTVVVTSFEPDWALLTAVDSLLSQTWSNLEILVVDDGSPSEHEALLSKLEALDRRVRVIRLRVNVGTYGAKNVGLSEASGEFVTFLDSDDWSVPSRIEQQAGELISQSHLLAVQSDLLNVTPELIITQPGRDPLFANASSLMFKRQPVLATIGYFDDVRKAADNEYIRRLKLTFGSHTFGYLHRHVHILRRLEPESLSYSEFKGGWVDSTRAGYWSAYAHWHDDIEAGRCVPYVPLNAINRPFKAPDPIARSRDKHRQVRSYDFAVLSDFRLYGNVQRAAIDEARLLSSAGFQVAIVQVESLTHPAVRTRLLSREVHDMIENGIVDQVFLSDSHSIQHLIVRYPAALQFAPDEACGLNVSKVTLVADELPFGCNGSVDLYDQSACTRAVYDLFGVQSCWVSGSPEVRDGLYEVGLRSEEVSSALIPCVVGRQDFRIMRSGVRSSTPIVGCHDIEVIDHGCGTLTSVREFLPDSQELDVRLMAGANEGISRDKGELPPDWVGYSNGELSVWDFLFQLDFWLCPPDSPRRLTRAMTEAMEAGCVIVAPDGYRDVLGDTAIYTDAENVGQVLKELHSDVAEYLQWSERAQRMASNSFSVDDYLRYMVATLPTCKT